ncbi:hypothetical protein VDG1235_2685 [Verrucomicrobiia bacterium DG1235]|nr:hypothetical protein VDG1235_2685 [Verrucomicrobiae bacterium DG1235]
MNPLSYVSLFALLFASAIQAAEEIPIWPGLAPGTENRPNEETITNERFRNIYQPSLTVHLPPRELATGASVLICPGGGYRHLAIFKEGHHTSSWLNSLGITAFVLKYRLNEDEALQDSLQAMRYIRQNANRWQIDPNKLGLMGFSAGGHLLLNTVSHADASAKPNFLVVMYPVTRGIDLETAFPANASPTIVFGASDDTTTPPANAISVYQSVLSAGHPTELHLYETGGHGFGLGLYRGPVIDWTDRCEVWFEKRGLLTPPEKN